MLVVRVQNERAAFAYTLGHERFDVEDVFNSFDSILPDVPESARLHEMLSHFECAPITGIHLWFDRQISDLDHAVLLDRTIQWMFHKSKYLARGNGDGSYVELVVSASNSLVEKSRQEITDLALSELAEFFPAVRSAKLLKSTNVGLSSTGTL